MSDLFPGTIETERLTLERLSREHVDLRDFYRIASRHEPDIEEVTRHLTWTLHATPKETKGFLDLVETQWGEGSGASYLIRPREPEPDAGEIAGVGGLTIDWERRTGTLGTWLRKPFWGRGYSGERADALLELAFDRLDLELVAVTHEVGNEKSRRAIEKYVERNGGQFDCLLRNTDVRGVRKPSDSRTDRNSSSSGDGETIDQRRYTVSREQYVG